MQDHREALKRSSVINHVREQENRELAKIAPVERPLRFSIEQLEAVYPCLRRRFDLFEVWVQLSLPRPRSKRVGKVELRESWH